MKRKEKTIALTNFALSCNKDIKSMSWEQYLMHREPSPQPSCVEVVQACNEKPSPLLPESNVLEVSMSHDDEEMKVWILPALSNAVWPSFIGGSKQIRAAGKRLLMVRMSVLDRNLYKSLFDLVMAGQSGVVFGHDGTGKTSGLNIVHFWLIIELRRPGTTLMEVAHRVDGRIFLYSLNKSTKKVECTVTEKGATLLDVKRFCQSREPIGKRETRTVLLLELDESEADPHNHGVPTLVSVAAGDGEAAVIEMIKGGGARTFVQSPPTAAEVHMLAKALYFVDKEEALFNAGLPPNSSEDAFLTTIDKRVLDIGGVVRNMLNGLRYADFCKKRESHAKSINSEAIMMTTNDYSAMPKIAKYFFASYAIDDCDQSVGNCKVKYLSDNAAALVSEKGVLKDEDIQTMVRAGLDHQCVMAVMLKHGLRTHAHGSKLQSPLPEGLDRDKWEVYNDPGFTHRLTDTHRRRVGLVPTSFSELLPGTTSPGLHLFHSQYLCKDVSELRANTVWRSTVVNGPVGECLSMHVDDKTDQKIVTFFCCTSMRNKNHPISVSVLHNWFQNLGLFKEENLGVKVRIVMFCDWHQETEYGLKFVATEEDLPGASEKILVTEKAGCPPDGPVEVHNGEMESSDLVTHFPEIGSRLETFIVRAGIHLRAIGSVRRDVPRTIAPKSKKVKASKKEKKGL